MATTTTTTPTGGTSTTRTYDDRSTENRALYWIIALLAVGLGVVELIALPFGGIGVAPGVLLGLFAVIAALAIAAAIGRRRRDRARKAPPV